MATKEPVDTNIPTLVDVIVPGKTEVEGSTRQDDTSPADTSAKRDVAKNHTLSKATLNAKIEALVAEILIRHMDDARKEIIRRVLSEIDSYMDKASERR